MQQSTYLKTANLFILPIGLMVTHLATAAPNLDALLGPVGSTATYEVVWDGHRGTLQLPRPASLTAVLPRPSGRLPVSTAGTLTVNNSAPIKVSYWLGGAGESFCVQPGTCLPPWGISRTKDIFGGNINVVIAGAPGYQGNGNELMHRIMLMVDFQGTPTNILDDQIFDGYIHTRSSSGFSGMTWWGNIPFGFHATKR